VFPFEGEPSWLISTFDILMFNFVVLGMIVPLVECHVEVVVVVVVVVVLMFFEEVILVARPFLFLTSVGSAV
jgi:hypothetical protein